MRRIFFVLLLCLTASLGLDVCPGVWAGSFPTKNIKWVVPYSPGGGVDVLTRGIAREMAKRLNVSVIVQNMPGGGGRIGASRVFISKPDGHTMGTYVSGSLIIPQILFGDAPYDVNRFEWVASPFQSPFGVWVSRKSSLHTLADLKKLGRPVWIAEIDITASPVPPTVLLMKELGVEYKYVTGFGGQALMNPAVQRGEADFFVRTVPSQRPWYNEMRAIVTMSPQRHPLAPDVPTLGEQIGPAAEEILPLSSGIYLVGATPGSPASAVQVLEDALLEGLDSPTFTEWAKRAGYFQDVTKAGSAKTKEIVNRYVAALRKHAATLKAIMKR